MNLLSWFSNLFKTSGKERPSPGDIVPSSSISIVDNRVVIDVTKLNIPLTLPPIVWTPHVADTGSMDPVIDYGANNIFIAGANETDQALLVNSLKVGDMAAYRFPADPSKPTTAFINHRIVKICADGQGRYFRFRGDNNASQDPFIAHDENIKWMSIGIIY